MTTPNKLPVNNTLRWYLQMEENRFGEAFVADRFWDNYIHPGCKVIRSQDENPFEMKESANG